jgi:heme/copper-type cytochrome/quinol oxidase subunit 3
MEASAPHADQHFQPEPREWQPRAIWVGGRLLCGSISFFFASFLFGFFYLKALDVNHNWTIGPVHPSQGLGVTIMALFLGGAVIYRLAANRPNDVLYAGTLAVMMSLAAVGLQFFEYTTLDFGAASGGYAAVFIGWTSTYAVFAIGCVYWMETQIATLWRSRREGVQRPVAEGVPAEDDALMRAGIEACSFFWAFYAAIGVLAFIILYLV